MSDPLLSSWMNFIKSGTTEPPKPELEKVCGVCGGTQLFHHPAGDYDCPSCTGKAKPEGEI